MAEDPAVTAARPKLGTSTPAANAIRKLRMAYEQRGDRLYLDPRVTPREVGDLLRWIERTTGHAAP